MNIESIYDPSFKPYGQVLTGYDTEKLLWAMEAIPLPKEGTAYEPSIAALEGCDIFRRFQDHAYGGMPVQIGMCWGRNTKLNCLEYHRDSEVNIGSSDFILLLAKQEELVDGRLDTACVRAFRVPAGAVVEGDAPEKLGELLKKAVGWVLGGLLTVFVTYLTISGAVAGAADAHAVKLAKSAVSAAVPVVGGILSDAAESVLAGAGLLRGMVGTLGTLALLGACLTPFLHLGCQYLFYQAASLVSAAAGPKKLTRLIAMLGDAFALVLAMTGTSAVLLLISLLSSMTALAPG